MKYRIAAGGRGGKEKGEEAEDENEDGERIKPPRHWDWWSPTPLVMANPQKDHPQASWDCLPHISAVSPRQLQAPSVLLDIPVLHTAAPCGSPSLLPNHFSLPAQDPTWQVYAQCPGILFIAAEIFKGIWKDEPC